MPFGYSSIIILPGGDNRELEQILWSLNGIRATMRVMQTYDEFSEDIQNLFWVIMKELERDVEALSNLDEPK